MARRGRPKKAKVKEKKQKVTAVKKYYEDIPLKTCTKEELTEAAILNAFELLGIAQKLDAQQKSLFIEIAKLHHLNPLKREIHAVPMQGKLVPVTGYEVYIQRARETGLLQYWRVDESGSGADYVATLVIKRRDWPQEFTWSAPFKEVKRNGPMWQERPTFMTKKVAISQGFRLCFGEELGGMPYTVEEMGELPPDRNEPRRLSERKVEPVGATDAGTGSQVFELGGQVSGTTEDGGLSGGCSSGGSTTSEPADRGTESPNLFASIIKKLNASPMEATAKIEKMRLARENKENPEKLKEILDGIV